MDNDSFPEFRPKVENPEDNFTTEVVRDKTTIPEGLRAHDISVGVMTDIDFQSQSGAGGKLVLSVIEGDTRQHINLLKTAGYSPERSYAIPVRLESLHQAVFMRFSQDQSSRIIVFMIGYGSPDTANPDFRRLHDKLHDLITNALYKAYKGNSTFMKIEHYAPGDIRKETLAGDIP